MCRRFPLFSQPRRTHRFGWLTLLSLLEKWENRLGINGECQVWLKTPGKDHMWFHFSPQCLGGNFRAAGLCKSESDGTPSERCILAAMMSTQRQTGEAKVRETQGTKGGFQEVSPLIPWFATLASKSSFECRWIWPCLRFLHSRLIPFYGL